MNKPHLMAAWAFILGCACICPWTSFAAEWKDKAEAEGRLVFYTTANTADTKALTDSDFDRYIKLYQEIFGVK